MPLTLTIDYALPELVEPGFSRTVSARELGDNGQPEGDLDAKALWSDEPTRTVMLRPLQLRSEWLNSTQALPSIIRLDDMVVAAADLTNKNVFEAPVGNNANPYIWHVPIGPSAFFPSMAGPGSPPNLVGISEPGDLSDINVLTRVPLTIYDVPATMPPAATPPAPTSIGDDDDGRYIFRTEDRLPANQGLYLRWFHPRPDIGWPTTYSFEIGQFALFIKDVVVEVYRDTSPHGTRTSWKRVQVAPLFSVRAYSPVRGFDRYLRNMPTEDVAHDRALLWLPFRRNQVLLYSSTQQWAVVQVNGVPRRLPDNSDWDIVREDTLRVWALTPSPGRFQIQKLAYTTGDVVMQSPTVTLDYTPGVDPTITLREDSDHLTTITHVLTQPPSYTLPEDDSSDCPPVTTDPATDQSRTYGIELTLNASADGRWTPFLYGHVVAARRTFQTRPTTPKVIAGLSSAAFYLEEARITAGMKPGKGRLTARVLDRSPYGLEAYYYRSYFPVQLLSGADSVFVGWSEPNEVEPLKRDSLPRSLVFSALDRWKQLADTWLTDQRDWSGVGHIEVVKTIMEQAGVDVTSMVTPPLTNQYNTKLGLFGPTVAQESEAVKSPWKPTDEDTAATFIERINEVFAPSWDVGFYLDGNPFYLPRDWFTTPTVTFYATRQDAIDDGDPGGPLFWNPVNFRTIEPEANVIQVTSGDANSGGLLSSKPMIDYASIDNPNVVNYLGRWRAQIIQLPAGWTCPQLNHAARVIWQETRRRVRTVEFEAEFVPTLKQGHIIKLGQGPDPEDTYGEYRITEIQAEFVKDHWRPASYTAELNERGYGLPPP